MTSDTAGASRAPQASAAGIAAAIVAMVGWSASGVIAKGIEMDALAVIFYRMWMYTAVMFVVLAVLRKRLTWAKIRAALPGGIALGVDITLFFSAVKLTTMANATVIGALQPVLMLVAGPYLFGASERATRREAVLAAIAIVGVAVVMFGSTGLPDWRPRGDLLALGGLCAWTLYFVFSKRTQQTMHPMEYTAATAVISTVFITPIALVSGQDLSLPSANHWVWLVLLTLGPGLVAHGAMNWSLTRIPMWLGATLALFIPVTSTLLAWAFIDEQVAAIQFVGMAVVLVTLVFIVLRPKASSPAAADGTAPTTATA